MNLRRLIETELGKNIISILLGLGLNLHYLERCAMIKIV